MRLTPGFRRPLLTGAVASAFALPAAAQHSCNDYPPVATPATGWSAPLDMRVNLRVRDVSLRDALDHLTAASGVQLAYSADFLPVDRRVCITVDSAPLGAILGGLLRNTHVRVLLIAGRVVLAPGAQATEEMSATARGVSVLDRVVVTGNAVASPRRPLTVGLEIIDGEQMRRQALGSLAELLDAAVPGVWAWQQSPSGLVSQYGGIRGSSSFGASAPKIYVDGVEVANPLLVTQLNPEVIDHVEVIRGPQGSALYGSDAISGVVNILTRHDGGAIGGTSVSLRSVAGAASSAYTAGLVPEHEQRLAIRTGSNAESAGLAVTYGQMGDLYPSSSTRQVAATADARLVASNATYTGTARYFDKSAGMGRNPLLTALIPSTIPPSGSGSRPIIASPDQRQSVRQYTLSTNATIAPGGAWTHTLLAGIDGYSLNNIGDASGPLPSQLDSALRAARGNGDRVTLRASSVAHLGAEGESDGTLTFGVEESVLRLATTQTTRIAPTNGQLYPTAIDALVENWQHDTGLLSQLTMAWHDAMYVSGGLRLERNDAFSGHDRYPLLPMIGMAAVRGYGETELKWRAAYGKGIRPPQTPARATSAGYAGTLATSSLGAVIPALDPEEQSGYEGGVELYVGRTLSMQLTRFDQHVTGLIQNVATGVDTVIRGKTIERRVRYELQNIGEITNTGWELQGNFSYGPFSLASALSSVDSRVRKLARGYNGDLKEGDRILAVPAKTSSLTISYLDGPWFAALGATRALDWINYDRYNIAVAYTKATTSPSREITGPRLRSYWIKYDGDTHLRLTVSRELLRGVSLLMVGDNLLGGQLGEPDNVTIRAGRSLTGGLRASF